MALDVLTLPALGVALPREVASRDDITTDRSTFWYRRAELPGGVLVELCAHEHSMPGRTVRAVTIVVSGDRIQTRRVREHGREWAEVERALVKCADPEIVEHIAALAVLSRAA